MASGEPCIGTVASVSELDAKRTHLRNARRATAICPLVECCGHARLSGTIRGVDIADDELAPSLPVRLIAATRCKRAPATRAGARESAHVPERTAERPLLGAPGLAYARNMKAGATKLARTMDTRARSAPVAAPLRRPAFQRLTSELGNRRVGQIVARAREGHTDLPSRRVHPSVALLLASSRGEPRREGAAVLARAVASREGRSLNPNELEEIEGRVARTTRAPARALQRLKITQVTPDFELMLGTCGERNVQWIFSLDKPAPEDGYIVQHITGAEDIVACPGPLKGTMTKTTDFWEAWFVKKGDIVEHMMAAGKFNFTDGSTRGPSPNTVGVQASDGTVKFFGTSTTGDLGKDGVAPADPASKWGPGKVPTSGDLPSTPTKPPWWDNASTEGPAIRQAKSEWNCCGADATRHTSRVTAYPLRPRCEVKDWF